MAVIISGKAVSAKIRESLRQEAALLAVFLAGFRAGKQTAEEEAAAARRQGAAMPPV